MTSTTRKIKFQFYEHNWEEPTRDKAEFFARKNKQCLFLVFRNNFKEITNTSLFLQKQLDYSLSISVKR